jgi:MFS family permease
MIAGTVFLSHFSHRIPKWVIAAGGFGISGLFLILLATVRDVGSALVVSFFLGFGDILIVVVVQTILQHHVPRPMRGRIFGIQNMLINSAFTFPVVFFGGLADWIGLSVSFVSLGIVMLMVGTLGMLLPSFRAVQ